MAINSAVVVEYLKALVKTDQISQFSQAGVVRYSPHRFWLILFELVLLKAQVLLLCPAVCLAVKVPNRALSLLCMSSKERERSLATSASSPEAKRVLIH